jgi:TonB family protein
MINEPAGKDDLKIGIGFSLALHVFIVGVFVIKFFFFSKPVIDLSQAISVSIGELAPDTKLPQKVLPAEPEAAEPEAAAPVEESSPDPKPKPEAMPKKKEPPAVKEKEISLSKAKQKQKDALSRLKKMSALDKIKQDLKTEATARPNAKPAKPRIVAAGTALSGLDRLDANTYLAQVDQSIKNSWTLPQWLLNKPLKARVLVKISPAGGIISANIISSSGNASYDDYCLQAVNKAAPFPGVPDKLSEKFSVDGVVVGFPE